MVPIFCGIGDTKTIIWKNPATSSTRYCRPIKLVFAKEPTDLIAKVNYLRQQIEMLTPTKVSFGNLNTNYDTLYGRWKSLRCHVLPHNAVTYVGQNLLK